MRNDAEAIIEVCTILVLLGRAEEAHINP